MSTQVNNRTQRQNTYETQVNQQQAPNRTAGSNARVGGGSHSVDPASLPQTAATGETPTGGRTNGGAAAQRSPRMYNTAPQTGDGSGQRGASGNAQGMAHSRQARAANSNENAGTSGSRTTGSLWQKEPAYGGPQSAPPQGYEKQAYSVQPGQDGQDQYTPVGAPSKSTTSAQGGFSIGGFSKGQEAILKQDIDKARTNSSDAWNRINQGSDRKFEQAFGKDAENDPQKVAEVKRTVGNIDYAIHNEHFNMRPSSEYEGDTSQKNTMFSDDGRNIYVKPEYFDINKSSQEHDGQIVRTLSHMPQVGDTADYTRNAHEAGRTFTEGAPQLTVHNSDSYRSYITPKEAQGTNLADELGIEGTHAGLFHS